MVVAHVVDAGSGRKAERFASRARRVGDCRRDGDYADLPPGCPKDGGSGRLFEAPPAARMREMVAVERLQGREEAKVGVVKGVVVGRAEVVEAVAEQVLEGVGLRVEPGAAAEGGVEIAEGGDIRLEVRKADIRSGEEGAHLGEIPGVVLGERGDHQ